MTVEYDRLKWTRAKNGYYQATVKSQERKNWLHQYVYEKERGAIPPGLEIHHVNNDKDDNSIGNLELLDSRRHHEKHGEYKHANPDRYRRQLEHLNRVRPDHVWPKDPVKYEEHRQALIRGMARIKPVEMICEQCGKTYMAKPCSYRSFCSNACKSAYRRSIQADNVDRVCVVCGAAFSVNKYRKTITCTRSCANVIRGRTMKNAVG